MAFKIYQDNRKMKTIEFTAKYRTGTGFITCKTSLAVRNIQYMQEIPPETPEFKDGMITTIAMITGIISSVDSYETLSARYNKLMEQES